MLPSIRYNRGKARNEGIQTMAELSHNLGLLTGVNEQDKLSFVAEIIGSIEEAGYVVTEVDDTKPWGAYIRIANDQADRFVEEFFPGLSPDEARLGIQDAELTPKILVVSPQQRLSWQFHERRAERWTFLTEGGYFKSIDDEQGELQLAKPGETVQFSEGERHRLAGIPHSYVIVAEIWQHSNPQHLSEEADIIRLADDYAR